MTKCTICPRADVDAIDEALRTHRPLRAIAEQFKASSSTLDRHKQHVTARRASTPKASRAAAPSAQMPIAPPVRMTSEQLISELEAVVQQQLLRVAGDDNLGEGERSKIQTAAIAGLVHLAKLQGRTEMSERRIMASPAMRRIQDRMIAVLSQWPDALRAVGEALLELGEGQGS